MKEKEEISKEVTKKERKGRAKKDRKMRYKKKERR